MRVYFDNAATTALDEEVLEAMLPYMKNHFGNPSAIHAYGRETRAAIERSRKTVAKYLNASTGEIFFTSGGTESSNMAIKCAVNDLGVKHIISSELEHHCVLHTVEEMAHKGIKVHYVHIKKDGHIDLEHLEELLKGIKEPKLVSLMHANNEIGNVLDIQKVGEICAENNAFFHTDTVQTIGHFNIDVQEVKVHFLTGSGHKFHGPKGVGFIFINSDVKVKPFISGGAQERNMRAGTENIYGIVGLGKAVEIAYEQLEEHRNHIEEIRSYMISKLQEEVPGVSFNGDYNGSYLYTVLNVSFPPSDKSALLLFNLDINGIAASSGSACSSGSDVGSHVLQAIKADPNRVSIRFSFSKFNTKEEVDYVVEKLKELIPVQEKVS